MLRTLPNITFEHQANTKCGEIYCQSATDFTIICHFCEMKIFAFEDFILHFKNVHFQNNSSKTDSINSASSPELKLNVSQIKSESEDVSEGQGEKPVESKAITEATGSALTNKTQANYWFQSDNSSMDEDVDFDDDDITNDNDWVNSEIEADNNDVEYQPKKNSPHKTKTKTSTKSFQCEHCKKFYKTKDLLKVHLRKAHDVRGRINGLNRYNCEHCPEYFQTQRDFNAHVIEKHDGFQCLQCQKKYSCAYELKRHSVIHTGVKNFVCDYENCGKSYHSQRRLNDHRRIHDSVKNYVCETCGYSCRIKQMLIVHSRKHTGEKPYACNLCQKSFATQSMLKEHEPIHSTERPHVCGDCGATFSRPKALYHHKHLHLGIKKFKCKICGNAYAQASGLAGHMRQHKQALLISSD